MTITDPCDPPASISPPVPGLVDQSYTLTDPSAPDYVHAEFTTDPAFCEITYSYNIDPLDNGLSAVTQSGGDRTFQFFYDNDNTPIDATVETQLVTVTATSSSKFGVTQPTISTTDDFEVSFNDPCVVPGLVTITPTTQVAQPLEVKYDNVPVQFNYNEFTVSPSYCEATVTC